MRCGGLATNILLDFTLFTVQYFNITLSLYRNLYTEIFIQKSLYRNSYTEIPYFYTEIDHQYVSFCANFSFLPQEVSTR